MFINIEIYWNTVCYVLCTVFITHYNSRILEHVRCGKFMVNSLEILRLPMRPISFRQSSVLPIVGWGQGGTSKPSAGANWISKGCFFLESSSLELVLQFLSKKFLFFVFWVSMVRGEEVTSIVILRLFFPLYITSMCGRNLHVRPWIQGA